MEKKENVNVEEKIVDMNKSLLRKTKAELVNIILRKDDTETKLRKENKALRDDCVGTENALLNMKNKYKDLKLVNEKLTKDLNSYKIEYENKCDEITDIDFYNFKLKKENTVYKAVSFVSLLIFIVLFIISVIKFVI